MSEEMNTTTMELLPCGECDLWANPPAHDCPNVLPPSTAEPEKSGGWKKCDHCGQLLPIGFTSAAHCPASSAQPVDVEKIAAELLRDLGMAYGEVDTRRGQPEADIALVADFLRKHLPASSSPAPQPEETAAERARREAHEALDRLIDWRAEEPELPTHACTLGQYDCDAVCMNYAHWSDEWHMRNKAFNDAAARAQTNTEEK